jgi:hypothetical protein
MNWRASLLFQPAITRVSTALELVQRLQDLRLSAFLLVFGLDGKEPQLYLNSRSPLHPACNSSVSNIKTICLASVHHNHFTYLSLEHLPATYGTDQATLLTSFVLSPSIPLKTIACRSGRNKRQPTARWLNKFGFAIYITTRRCLVLRSTSTYVSCQPDGNSSNGSTFILSKLTCHSQFP